MADVRVKGIVTREDAVEVDISVKEDIDPQYIGESRAVDSYDKSVLGSLDIKEVVSAEGEHV